ncbi:TPA_asm: radical SAM domain protein [Caudoviricetes sp. vir520]|nr:TPA_asm: radical SAM domain protein [Caudoviricetes sp. vir520]
MIQVKLIREERKPIFQTTYDKPQYNAVKGDIQRIELHRGCPWSDIHDYCYEPSIYTDFSIPELVKNKVQILDMNFLARKDALNIINKLGSKRVDKKAIYYNLVCGIDFRFLTQEMADTLKKNKFIRPRLAWDGPLKDQYKIKDAIKMLLKAGYKRKQLMLFMIVNWKIPYADCLRKLDLMKVWNVKVCDCCYDGGYKYAQPEYWTQQEIDSIRVKSRKHNQIVLFEIDPQLSINPYRFSSDNISNPKQRGD